MTVVLELEPIRSILSEGAADPNYQTATSHVQANLYDLSVAGEIVDFKLLKHAQRKAYVLEIVIDYA